MLLFLLACSPEPAPAPKAAAPAPKAETPAPAVKIDPALVAAFKALPTDYASTTNPSTPEKVALGRMLYYDARLSKNQDVSCNSCHLLDAGGVDGMPTSTGHKSQKGGRNAPTVYNAAGHLAQFWDGRAADVEAQAKGPVLNPIEMAMPNEAAVVKVLKSIPGYVTAFQAAFPADKDPVTYDNMALAIGAFERGLVTPSAWDRFLAGDATALTDAQKEGFNTFAQSGCTTCHSGALVGGGMYQKLGMVNPWPDTTSDEGRFAVTKVESDKMFFKVPSLRNITKTAPYFHNGSVATLPEAIKKMGHHQLGKELTDAQINSIATWLGSLEGTVPPAYIAKPELPVSGPNTPKADPS